MLHNELDDGLDGVLDGELVWMLLMIISVTEIKIG